MQIETLKKFNKLFSDDNNYLRSRLSLLIPIEVSTEGSSNIDSDLSSAQTSSSSLDGRYPPTAISNSNFASKISSHHSMNFENQHSKHNNNSAKHLAHSPNKSKSLCDSSQVDNNRDNNTLTTHESVADFLIRIDSSIAKTKNQVEKMSQKNDINSIEEELFRGSTKRFSTPKLTTSDRSAISASSSSRHSAFPIFDSDGNVPRVVTSNSNKRKVKSSLKRHAKNQEEIFELWCFLDHVKQLG